VLNICNPSTEGGVRQEDCGFEALTQKKKNLLNVHWKLINSDKGRGICHIGYDISFSLVHCHL
jgi:hypothetical protein